jgi:hypothetical protein
MEPVTAPLGETNETTSVCPAEVAPDPRRWFILAVVVIPPSDGGARCLHRDHRTSVAGRPRYGGRAVSVGYCPSAVARPTSGAAGESLSWD